MNFLEFDCYIMDMAEGITDHTRLTLFSDRLHQHIEIALQDYASDHDITDYEPNY